MKVPPANESRPASAPVTAPAIDDSALLLQAARRKRRRVVVASGLLIFTVAAVSAVAVTYFFGILQKSEDEIYQLALSAYGEGRYGKAAKDFETLQAKYPNSDRREEYAFLQDLSEVRIYVSNMETPSEDGLERLGEFIREHEQSPFFATYAQGIGETLERLAADLAQSTIQFLNRPRNLERARLVFEKAKHAHELAVRYSKGQLTAGAVASTLDTARRLLGRVQLIEDALRKMARFAATPDNLKMANDLARRLHLGAEPEAQRTLEGIRNGIFASVSYSPSKTTLASTGASIPTEPTFLVDQPTGGTDLLTPARGGVVFAIARGVLYALASSNGEVLWFTRVGIDTTTLPVRFPPREATPEIALVLSSDTNVLTAREVLTGREFWRHDLKSPCLGKPLVVEEMAYVPTYDGTIFEIEVPTGQLRGEYHVGAPLTGGGAHQRGTDLLYFPAQGLLVYVFNRKEKRCVGILETDHPSGSLRGDPIIVSPDEIGTQNPAEAAGQPGYLILNETDGLKAMKLAAYRLPIGGMTDSQPVEPQLRFPGWSWFPPVSDGERIALVTDAGTLHLVGINQPNNQDRPLFPLVPPSSEPRSLQNAGELDRGQVVHGGEHGFWVLSHGELQQFCLGLNRQKGTSLSKVAQRNLQLGTPLHSSQVNEARDTLFVVTQDLDNHECLVTAVATDSSQVRWQRRLGVVCGLDPLAIDGKVVVIDEGGSLLYFDPAAQPIRGYQTAGETLSGPLAHARPPALLLSSPDRKRWYELACTGQLEADGRQAHALVVRRFETGHKDTQSFRFPLAEALQGTPAVGDDTLILPLASGEYSRLNLMTGTLVGGASWRGPQSDPQAPGHILHLGPTEFLTTDGGRSITLWRWPQQNVPMAHKSAVLSDRIVAAPFLVEAGKTQAICIADASGTITLIRAMDLSVLRSWRLHGEITTGPFLRGTTLGCVLDRRRLVWLDLDRSEPLWEHPAADTIVGRPQIVDGAVLVADVSGKVVALDPATGRQRGAGLNLQGTVVAAGAPVGFGAERIFLPLSDGTILLPAAKQFR
jgi:outer membrane protein assembly factor BamB